jgi:hypothetical protein
MLESAHDQIADLGRVVHTLDQAMMSSHARGPFCALGASASSARRLDFDVGNVAAQL